MARSKKGGSPEDEATRPAAYRLPPPEQLPETSLTDDTRIVCDDPLMLPDIEPAPPAVEPVPVPAVEEDVPPAPVDVLDGFVELSPPVLPMLLLLELSIVP